MTAKTILMSVALVGMTAFVASCDKDNPQPMPADDSLNDLGICSMISNTDGMSGTAWLQLTDAQKPRVTDNRQAFQVNYGIPPSAYGDDIFTVPDIGSSNTIFRFNRSKDGKLTRTGQLDVPAKSTPYAISFYSKTKAYVSTLTGKILIMNPEKMQITGSIDITKYAETDKGVAFPQFGSIHFDGNHAFVALWQCDANRMPKNEPGIDMLVIDVNTNKVINRVQKTCGGLTFPGYVCGDEKGHYTDEKGDNYLICCGTFGMPFKDYKTGIIRIKKGETDIDDSYNWVMNNVEIDGKPSTSNWLITAHYAGNGKLYAQMDMSEYWTDKKGPKWMTDRSVAAVEIDLYNKTVKRLPVPNTCAYASHVTSYNELILFAVYGEKDSGFYSYDPKTGKASQTAVVSVKGYPFWCHQFK